jgi:hypothetical protein
VHVQRLESVFRMVTVLEGYSIDEQRSVMLFLWSKGLDAKDIHNEMYSGKCLSCLFGPLKNRLGGRLRQMMMLKLRCGSGRDSSQNTSMLRVSTHW